MLRALLALCSAVGVGARCLDRSPAVLAMDCAAQAESRIAEASTTLRRTSPVAGRQPRDDEDSLVQALRSVEASLFACANEVNVQRRFAALVIDLCSEVVADRRSPTMQQHTLALLALVAAHSIDSAGLRRIVAVCEQFGAVAQEDDMRRNNRRLMHVLNIVATSSAADTLTLRLIVDLLLKLMMASGMQDDDPQKPLFFYDAMAMIAGFAHRVAADAGACTNIVRAAHYVVDVTRGETRYFLVRLQVAYVLDELLGVACTETVLADILGVVEICAEERAESVSDMAALLLHGVAGRIGEAHLERVVGVCGRDAMARKPEVQRALEAVQRRALAPTFRGGAALRLRLIAQSFALQERTMAAMPCWAAVECMHDGGDPPEPAGALRWLSRGSQPLAPELAMLVDEFLPLLAEGEGGALRRLPAAPAAPPGGRDGLCGDLSERRARRRHRPHGLRGHRQVSPGQLAQHAGHRASEYLRGLDAAGVERAASALLEGAMPILGPGERRGALRVLCGLVGGLHDGCAEARKEGPGVAGAPRRESS